MSAISRYSILLTGPKKVDGIEETLGSLPNDRVLVRVLQSAISPGTEMLIYRGQFPADLELDSNIPALRRDFSYPTKYGYCAVGQVIACGKEVDSSWMNRRVFAFHPHETHFYADPGVLIPLPSDILPEQAVFLPNMETAVNLVMDSRPMIGERVLVLGQGIVGLLTTALLAKFPLNRLVTMDRFPLRRQASIELGAAASLDPDSRDLIQEIQSNLAGEADLCLELSGSSKALDSAISFTGFGGRVVIGSWYGSKPITLNLGGKFHRSRLRLISSQVSTIAPEHTGRWDKSRRFDLAWEMIRAVRPECFITHRIPIREAAQAYQLIDEHPEQTIQVVLTYS